jgi:hypothetical protein
MAVYLMYSISKAYNLEIATSNTKVFGFVGTDHLRAKIITNIIITETILKLYNTLVLPTFLYGSENWTLTASQRRQK